MDRSGRLELIQRYGWNTTSFQTLEPHFEYWFDTDGPGMVAYYQTMGTWVAAGAPVAPPERVRDCALGFARAANEAGNNACFFGVFQRFIEQMGSTAQAVKIGEQPWWNPRRWDQRSDRRRSVGTQVRRAERLGVAVSQLDPLALEDPDSIPRRAAQSVMDAWQRGHRMATMSFTVFLDPFSFPEQRRYFLADQKAGGESEALPVGFLALVPVYARNGWFLEDIVRRPGAPNGTAEAMIDCAMRAVAAEGAEYATLGLSPLHGVEQSLQTGPWWLRWAVMLSKRYLNALYSFEGLAAFKSKFRPDGWEDIYLVGMSRITPRMLLAVLVAFTRSRPAQFAVSTLRRLIIRWLRRIEPVTWRRVSYGFAMTLVLWMVLLSRVDSLYWFDSDGMRDSWIIFDCIMVAMFLLLGTAAGRRRPFTPYLALVGSGAALTDAFLTAMQAIHFHILRGVNSGELALWLVAVSGPLLAGCFLLVVGVEFRGRHTSS